MKTPVFHSAFFALLGLLLSPLAVAHALSPPADSVHFYAPFDYEQWERDHPRPAAKRLANLDVGPSRTVRLIYFLPNDRPYRAAVVNKMKTMARRLQTFYGEQMQAHGYGDRAFRLETDAAGELIVHRVDGRYSDSSYLDYTLSTVQEELRQAFDLWSNIYIIVIDNSIHGIGFWGQLAAGVGIQNGKNGGVGLFSEGFGFGTMARELGHTFGLEHDFRDNAYIMSYGPGEDRLSACAAEFLAVHPYFNHAVSTSETHRPTIELISPHYPAGSNSASVQLRVRASEGLHQVILFAYTREPHFSAGFPEVKACRGLAGERETVVEFDYDGVVPSAPLTTSLSMSPVHSIAVEAVDRDGNVGYKHFTLAEISPYHIATLEAHADWGGGYAVWVAFSPDGETLATGSENTVKLWDVATKTNIATITTLGTGLISSVVFSPDGETLATGAQDGTITLWDVATKKNIFTFRTKGIVRSVAFSPDGAILASGGGATIRLRDVATKTSIAIFRITGFVRSVAFSPDGETLAVGSLDDDAYGTVTLWDVATKKNIFTFGPTGTVYSVAFSPDGETLAAGRLDRVHLWDVDAKTNIATFGTTGGVYSVAFSPDGETLAAGRGARIRLWGVATKTNIATFAATGGVYSVAFLPNGAILASGSTDGTVQLWDVSEWTESRSHSLVKTSEDEQQETEQETTTDGQSMSQSLAAVSGDGQEGPASTQLAEPFVVSVMDQDGSPLAGVDVTFAVTVGGGMLSAPTDTNPCTVASSTSSMTAPTDANGQAATRLTLGSQPGTNTVEATVEGLAPVTFTATAIERMPHSLDKVSGEDQEGPANTQLAEPFVVSVLDQGGSPLAGVSVTFAVTAGEGLLSSTTDTNPCTIEASTSSTTATTDANGQATTRLTLGSQPGTNTVEVTVEGLEPETFTATAAEQAMPHRLTKVCGDDQEGPAITQLDEPLVVFVSDAEDAALAGEVVSFAVTAGGGTLSSTTATTDANGRAATRLTLGIEAGVNAVAATVEGLEPVIFTATAQESPFASFFDALFGGGKRVALPDSPQLAQNAPNPFNSQTVLSYFLPTPGLARLEVFALTGQRVAVLRQGPQQAGYHRLHWDGRDDAGRSVASGMYLYRLVTDGTVLTRKLVLMR